MKNIFIIGCAPRCGTNYIFNILREHPDTVHPKIKNEDFLHVHAHLLDQYIKQTKEQYPISWGNNNIDFFEAIGDGLQSLLQKDILKINQKIITKTPTPKGINYFNQLFPNNKLVFVVRNGPDTIESYQKTFKTSFDFAIRLWRYGVNEILNNQTHGYLVKYEDFILNFDSEVEKLLNFCELSIDDYSFENGKKLGIVGSSQQKYDKNVSWSKEIAKNDNFKPIGKFDTWPLWKRWRYNYLCQNIDQKLEYNNIVRINVYNIPLYYTTNWCLNISSIANRIIKKLF